MALITEPPPKWFRGHMHQRFLMKPRQYSGESLMVFKYILKKFLILEVELEQSLVLNVLQKSLRNYVTLPNLGRAYDSTHDYMLSVHVHAPALYHCILVQHFA